MMFASSCKRGIRILLFVMLQDVIESLQQAAKDGDLSLVSRNSGEKRCVWGL